MHQAWYRKYRPQHFSELVGQEHVKVTLLNQIVSGQAAHAYLFSGPKGTGKTSVARILAKTLNCLTPDATTHEACDQCANCLAFAAGNMVDLIEVDAASHTQVEKMRELTSKVELVPTLGKYKIYVIDEAHMLSGHSFNALLKTLEEPPAHVVFVLATTEPDKFPATIVSRCQRFEFKLLGANDIVNWLKKIAESEKLALSPEVFDFVTEQSGGSLRDAVGLLEQTATLSVGTTREELSRWLGVVDVSVSLQLVDQLTRGDAKAVITHIGQLFEAGVDMQRLATSLAKIMRQLLAVKTGVSLSVSDNQLQSMQTILERTSLADIMWLTARVLELAYAVKQATVATLPFELLAVEASARFADKDDSPPNQPQVAIDQPQATSHATSHKPIAMSKTVEADVELSGSDEPEVEFVDKKTALAPAVWEEIVAQMSTTNPTAGAALARANIEVQDHVLRLKFALPFYKQAFEQNGYLALVAQKLADRGLTYKIECEIEAQNQAQSQGLELEDVTQVFS